MAGDLAAYVKEQLKKGYTKDQVKTYLKSYGYTESQIKQALPHGFNIFEKKTADPRLVSYIRQYSQRGYSSEQMRQHLSSYYDKSQLDLALKEVGTVHHVIHLSGRTIVIAIMMVAVLVGVVSIFLFIPQDQPAQLLDYKITTSQNQVSPGETLYCTNEFQNRGTKRFDILVENKIVNVATGDILDVSRGQTIEITTIDEFIEEFDIPEDAPAGKYRIEGKAIYKDLVATAYIDFRIIRPEAQPTCSDGILNQDENDVDCGGVCALCKRAESCFDRIKNQDEVGIDCGGSCQPCTTESCSDNIKNQNEAGVDCGGVCPSCITTVTPDNVEILEKVKSMGSYNEGESSRLCGTMTDTRLQNDCYEFVAGTFNSSLYCAEIASQNQANRCYMQFVMNKDYSVCEQIDNIYLRKNCESMRDIDSILGQINETQA